MENQEPHPINGRMRELEREISHYTQIQRCILHNPKTLMVQVFDHTVSDMQVLQDHTLTFQRLHAYKLGPIFELRMQKAIRTIIAAHLRELKSLHNAINYELIGRKQQHGAAKNKYSRVSSINPNAPHI
jgi:hypothetical protein